MEAFKMVPNSTIVNTVINYSTLFRNTTLYKILYFSHRKYVQHVVIKKPPQEVFYRKSSSYYKRDSNLITKEAPTQVFFGEFCEILKTLFLRNTSG